MRIGSMSLMRTVYLSFPTAESCLPMKFREAERADAEHVQLLYRQLIQNFANPSEVDVTPGRIEEIRTNPNNFLFLLETENRICGTAFITLCLDPMHGRQPYALLENVIIDAYDRGKGYGQRLMRYIEGFCSEKRCSKVMLLSNNQRKDAHQFFRECGFSSETKVGFVKYMKQFTTSA